MCEISKLKIHRSCKTPDDSVSVYIVTENGDVGLCTKCWGKVADSDFEWGKDPKPTVEELFGRRTKEEAEAKLTEYKPKSDYKPEEDEENV